MAITTWLTEEEQRSWTKVADKDVNELYQEVRKIKPDIFLHEVPYRTGNIFNRKWIMLYTVYHMLDQTEAQVINFYGLGGPYSSTTIMAFLIGCLTK